MKNNEIELPFNRKITGNCYECGIKGKDECRPLLF